jgi:dCMP deaminase
MGANMSRPDSDTYFMSIATQVATRATCDRKHVGAVLVRDRIILATGYNGASRKLDDCDTVGHELEDMGGRMSCVRTVHAEVNAIVQAARVGTAIDGATLYTTASCCYDCAKVVINAGIVRVVAAEFYGGRYGKSERVPALFAAAGVETLLLPAEAQAEVSSPGERISVVIPKERFKKGIELVELLVEIGLQPSLGAASLACAKGQVFVNGNKLDIPVVRASHLLVDGMKERHAIIRVGKSLWCRVVAG